MPTTPNLITDAVARADGTLVPSVDTVELPDIEQSSEEFEQLGMAGSVEIPTGDVVLGTATLTFSSYHPQDLQLFPPQQAVQLEVRASINDVTEDGVQEFPRIVTMRVVRQVRSSDELERQRDEGPELELAVHYIEDVLDGDTILEIDPVNRIFTFDGEDILDERRANLGF